MDEHLRELHRTRWRRFRRSLGLAAPGDASFARTGLAARLPDDMSAALLLITDEDPGASKVTPSPDTTAWWEKAALDVVTGAPGSTSAALVRWSEAREGRWSEYVALHWNGSLERCVAVGVAANGFVYLLPLVQQIRRCVRFYQDAVLPRTLAKGPWEISLGLRGIAGSRLQPFTPEGGYYSHLDPLVPEDDALIVLEIDDWPDDLVKHLAYRIASCWSIPPALVDRAFDRQREEL